MSLEDFIAELEKAFGSVHKSRKLIEDYDFRIVEPLREPPRHEPRTAYKAYWI